MGHEEISHGINDLQNGINAIVNNIPEIVADLGINGGLAGAITIMTVAINQLLAQTQERG